LPAKGHGSEIALDIASFISSAVPWIGGPVSNVLSGVSFGRKMSRVQEILEGIAHDLGNFKSEVSERYVKTEEFEELLEKTLRKAAEERDEEKRRIYRSFIVGAVKSPGEPYEEQIRFLRTLEEIQADHIKVLRALDQKPESDPIMSMMGGSPIQTLSERLKDMNENRIEDLINQLNDMRVTNITSLKTMMTWSGAQRLQNSITPYGKRFIAFVSS
jgi:hypothetical protein